MAWTQRHLPLPGDWKERRRQTATRAGWRCEARIAPGTRCANAGSECDHIINQRSAEGVAMGDRVHGLRNLQWLCASCHSEKTREEARAARAYRKSFGRHPGERGHYSYR